jgi:nicotinamide mononucleotide transporter
MSGLEIAAVVSGLACVYLTIRQSVLRWPSGVIQVLLYIVIFYEVKLYSDMLFQFVYVGLQIYGWHHWIHGGKKNDELPVSRLLRKARGIWVFSSLPSTMLLGFFMHQKRMLRCLT